jgi:S-adenosylmethionine:tRNA ribosyltransferase-isomerase
MAEYDYPLPDDRIAKFPLDERDQSRLLVYRKGEVSETVFSRLPDFLPAKSLMVFNNTRVIRARLAFAKDTGAQIEVFCLEPEAPRDYALNFQSRGQCRWTCLVGNLKRWKDGTLKRTLTIGNREITLTAERKQSHRNTHSIAFRWDGRPCAQAESESFTFAEVLDAAGVLPIPPYLHRETAPSDLLTYQTVYSKIKGSVAAPTAGLHFTPELLDRLDKNGFAREEVTLHVGAGTFKPVQADFIGEHEMHSEWISVDCRTVAALLNHPGRITAVGTTSVRTLESLYYVGAMLEAFPDATPEMLAVKQWTPYGDLPQLSAEEALRNIIRYLDKNSLGQLVTSTQIIIVPGYQFRVVSNLITNFHLPKSTLLLLVSSFVKGNWRKIYDYALNRRFRFLSYGDGSFLSGDDFPA